MKLTKKQQALFLLGLEKFIEFINAAWKESMNEEGTYTAESFTVTDKKRNLFGCSRILSCTTAANADLVIHSLVDDGDDGGSHDLIIGLECTDLTVKQTNFQVQFVMHGFDGGWHMIFNDGKFIHE